MKERPILFNGAMVRAILYGSKTQTRRVMKCQPTPLDQNKPDGYYSTDVRGINVRSRAANGFPEFINYCPYGHPGDRLWVRETWAEVGTCDPGLIVYRADYPACVPSQYENVPPASEVTWKPSIHMFLRHSRINLEITGVRVERLNDISDEDAVAEGVGQCEHLFGDKMQDYAPDEIYSALWQSINGPDSWEANPWVWVVEFKRVKP